MNIRDGGSEGATPTAGPRDGEAVEMPRAGAGESNPFALFDPPQDPDERGRFAGYRILDLLGVGGMGLVFEAEDSLLRRRVALKLMRPEMAGPAERARFLREAQAAAALHDDHVVTIHQVGEHDGRPFLVMERLRGESLEQRLERERWLPLPEALRLARQVALGLRAAHAVGLVHRDIKPANIWLEETDGGRGPVRVKILDFGLAKPLNNDVTLTGDGVAVGTPTNMAPEQLEASPVDARADLYALGVVLYRMIAGVPPFEAPSAPRLMAAILEQTPRPVSSIRVRVPAPVEGLLDELLRKDPDARPADAATVVERLRALDDQTLLVAAGAAPPEVEAAGPVRRRIGPEVWIGTLAIAASVLVGVVTLWHNLRFSAGAKAGKASDPPAVARDEGTPPKASEKGRPHEAGAVPAPSGEPIRVGLLHSLTGALSPMERPMIEAESLAIEEINQAGGLLGRPLEPVIADGRSDEETFAAQARKLIEQDEVAVLIGCLSSGSRKRVKEVCEREGVLLFYPMNFEGLEQSSGVVYVGGGPNQQLLPMIRWAISFFDPPRRKFYLLGCESLFSRAAQEIFLGELEIQGLKPVGFRSIPMGQVGGFDAILDEVRRCKADIVLDTLDPESDTAFFKALGRAGIKAETLPVVSLCLGEDQLRSLDPSLVEGHYRP
jgi:urea transport system substrate-binding protein